MEGEFLIRLTWSGGAEFRCRVLSENGRGVQVVLLDEPAVMRLPAANDGLTEVYLWDQVASLRPVELLTWDRVWVRVVTQAPRGFGGVKHRVLLRWYSGSELVRAVGFVPFPPVVHRLSDLAAWRGRAQRVRWESDRVVVQWFMDRQASHV